MDYFFKITEGEVRLDGLGLRRGNIQVQVDLLLAESIGQLEEEEGAQKVLVVGQRLVLSQRIGLLSVEKVQTEELLTEGVLGLKKKK